MGAWEIWVDYCRKLDKWYECRFVDPSTFEPTLMNPPFDGIVKASLAVNEVVEVAKECSKQYFFDLDYDSAEFYVAMERLYAAMKKLEEG